MAYDAKKEWTKEIVSSTIAFPAEYVIRMFKGSYPRLNLDKSSFKGKKVCDVGCGDGRNLVLLKQCGFDLYGVEISDDIVVSTKANLARVGISADIRCGDNTCIPFDNAFFDYVLSWNSCYYMGKNTDFGRHVSELARIIKPGGFLVLSIPKKSCFIFSGSEPLKQGYMIIRNDPFNVRNGELLRMFEDEREIESEFGEYFEKFIFGSVHDDCFGFDYHWHLVVCQRRIL